MEKRRKKQDFHVRLDDETADKFREKLESEQIGFTQWATERVKKYLKKGDKKK